MKHHQNLLKIGITMGDYNGIGPELIVRAFLDPRMSSFFTPIVYGSSRILNFYRKLLDAGDMQVQIIKSTEEAHQGKLNIINCWEDEIEVKPGEETEKAGTFALKALDACLKDIKEGNLEGMVTAPLNKNMVKLADGKTFHGHTGYIAEYVGASNYMMMLTSETLKVGLATVHVPLAEVSKQITSELIIQKIKTLNQSLRQDFTIAKPRIAVLGVNPHAGEGGLLGKEEQDIINPAVAKVRSEGIIVYGAYPADGFFGSGQFKQFDGVLAMYHDQGLVPFKYMNFTEGVNYTAGLPIVRTSPDHGTAYTLAGKGTADIQSFCNALFDALHIISARTMNAELGTKPLRFMPLKRERFRMDF
jgi:4-hydroxythreonine-4-phosphate dehydrogenase